MNDSFQPKPGLREKNKIICERERKNERQGGCGEGVAALTECVCVCAQRKHTHTLIVTARLHQQNSAP